MNLKNLKFKKTLILFLISGILYPSIFKVHAQLIVNDPPLTAVASGMAFELGIISTSIGVPGVEQGIISGVNAAVDAACKGVAKAEEVVATSDALSNFSLIGESPAEASALTAKILALQVVRTCREAQLEVYKKMPVTSLIIGQELVRKQAALSTEINELNIRLENLLQRQTATYKDVLKAVSIKLLLTFSQKLTTTLINSLIAKYKIGNYLKYADAVATQIYEKDHIQKNFSGKESQLIVASILNSDAVRGGVLPAVRLESQRALGFIPDDLIMSDPSYWVKLAQTGSGQANPYFMQTVYNDRAELARSRGQLDARAEISQGKGFIPVRNCGGSIAEQNNIYRQNVQMSYKVDNDREILERMQAQYILNPNDTQVRAEMEKAAAALGQSQTALENLPQELNSPIVTICESITNPGAFMADGIQGLLKSHIDQASNLRTENLPFYGQFIFSVADNLLTNIFFGGRSNLKLLTEAGVGAGNILSMDMLRNAGQPTELIAAAGAVNTPAVVSASVGFNSVDPTRSYPVGTYTLAWDATNYPNIDDIEVFGISGVCLNVVNGECRPITNLSGQAQVNFTTPGQYEFLLDVYTKDNQTGTPSQSFKATININSAGTVLGTTTEKVKLDARGSTPAVKNNLSAR